MASNAGFFKFSALPESIVCVVSPFGRFHVGRYQPTPRAGEFIKNLVDGTVVRFVRRSCTNYGELVPVDLNWGRGLKRYWKPHSPESFTMIPQHTLTFSKANVPRDVPQTIATGLTFPADHISVLSRTLHVQIIIPVVTVHTST